MGLLIYQCARNNENFNKCLNSGRIQEKIPTGVKTQEEEEEGEEEKRSGGWEIER